MNHPQQTPLEKLLADKQRIQQACLEQENKINKTFTYIQENAGSLLLSGLSKKTPDRCCSPDCHRYYSLPNRIRKEKQPKVQLHRQHQQQPHHSGYLIIYP